MKKLLCLTLLLAAAAPATTPPATPASHTPHKTATKTPARHVPVVKPRHSPVRRRVAAHPAAPPVPAPVPVPVPTPAPAPPPPKPAGRVTGLPLPRFVALRSDAVNLRVGPDFRYPVLWVYKRRDLPVEIEKEFNIWRQIEDMDGIKGWVHEATLVGRRDFVIPGTDDRTLRADQNDAAAAVAILKPGVVGRIRACAAGALWCAVSVGDYSGWLKRTDFWGAAQSEQIP